MDATVYQLKVAAAIAVLHTKPKGVDTLCYTRQFCKNYLQVQSQWRSRCFQMQDALLQLKQQIALSLIEHQVLSTSDEDHCLPTPPSITSDTEKYDKSICTLTSQQALASNSQFIHSIVSLAGIFQIKSTESPQLVTSLEKERPFSQGLDANFESLLIETVPACVRQLRMVVSNGRSDVSASCVLQALNGLTMLLNSDWICAGSGAHFDSLLQQLGGLVDDLLHHLFVENDKIMMNVETRKLLHKMLLELTTRMKVPERYSLLQSVATHAKSLCASLSHDRFLQTTVKPSCYECLAIAVDCLQQGVKSLEIEEFDKQLLGELQKKLEDVISHDFSNQFPLVAHTVMRLTSLIELCAKSNG